MKKWLIRLEGIGPGGGPGYARIIPRGVKGVWHSVQAVDKASRFDSKQDAESVAMLFASLDPEWIGKLSVRVWYGDRGGEP